MCCCCYVVCAEWANEWVSEIVGKINVHCSSSSTVPPCLCLFSLCLRLQLRQSHFSSHSLRLRFFLSIMCSSLCYRIADIAFSVCRTCVLYIFAAVLCFVPPIVVVGVHFCCLKNFFLLLKEPKWVHKFLSRPRPIPQPQQPLARAFFTQWRGFFSPSVSRFLLLLLSPSIIAVHRVRRFFPSHPIAVERNVSAHNTTKTYEALSVNVRAFFSHSPSAACSHSPSYRPRRRYEKGERGCSEKAYYSSPCARVCLWIFFLLPMNIFTQCVRILHSNSVQQHSAKISADWLNPLCRFFRALCRRGCLKVLKKHT